MKKYIFALICALAIFGLITSSAQAALFYSTRGSWIGAVGSYADVDIGSQVPEYSVLSAGSLLTLPYSQSLSFDSDLMGLQVPSSWATWSGGNTPAVLYTDGASSVTGTFGAGGVRSFGLEMEPNTFSAFDMTLLLSDGTFLTQSIEGASGAGFFGFTSDIDIVSMTLSTTDSDFAFGRLVIGEIVPVIPEPATMSLLGFGLLGVFRLRKRKV